MKEIAEGWIARDSADRLGLYDQMPTKKRELVPFIGEVVENWVIGDDWIGRFSLEGTTKRLFPNLKCDDKPCKVRVTIEIIDS